MKNYCVNCNKILVSRASVNTPKRCWQCYIKWLKTSEGRKSGNYKTGWRSKNVQFYCKECKKEVSNRAYKGSGLCKSCAMKGVRHWSYEKKSKLPACCDCGKLLTDYRSKRCRVCNSCNLLKRQGSNKKMNKPESILNQILHILFLNQYKFVGDGKVIIDRFNPDFIDEKNKKIIEMYGDYWHNLPQTKQRDKRRIKAYTKYNYKTLIIWEHELKDIDYLVGKLITFNIRGF